MGVGQELAVALFRRNDIKVGELLGRLDGQTVNETRAGGLTPLHEGCVRNHVRAVATVLAIPGVNVNARDNNDETPIMTAAMWGHCNSMRLLLDHHEVEVNARRNDGWTAIMLAAAECEVKALKMLVDHPSVDLDLRANDGRGVKELVGYNAGSSTEKSKCLDIIEEGRRDRIKKSQEQGRASNATDFSEPGASAEWSLGLEKRVEELVKQELVKQFSASAGPQIYIENMNVSVQNLVIQNLTAKLGVTDEREASELFKLLGAQEDAKQCEQKLTRLTESQVDFGLLKISTITRSTCLVDYASSNGNSWHGTGFLLTVDNFPGLIMLSTGHNFEDNGAILRDFKNFSFFFNNMSGQRSSKSNLLGALGAGGEDKECIRLNLQTLMQKYRPTLVITYKKMRLIQRGDFVISKSDLTGDDALFDYFALVFDDAGIRATLEKKGLRFLQCGSSAELSPNTGDPLLVFGHPGVSQCNCQKKKCSCAHPLRLSYGQETGSSTHRIQYDMDTLRGNSGSPITGKHCKVKGIHVSAADNKTQNFNMAQTVESVLQDLRKVNTLP